MPSGRCTACAFVLRVFCPSGASGVNGKLIPHVRHPRPWRGHFPLCFWDCSRSLHTRADLTCAGWGREHSQGDFTINVFMVDRGILSEGFFFVTTLSRYVLHTTQFTHLKGTVQLFLVYSQSCRAITTISFRLISSLQRESL